MLRQALEKATLSLPVAKVALKGSFGEIETEAAVSDSVLPMCPYLLSNRTAKQLLKSGITLDMNPVMIVTRSMAKKASSALMDTLPRVTTRDAPEEQRTLAGNSESLSSDLPECVEEEAELETSYIPPTSRDFQVLSAVDRESFIEEQKNDTSLQNSVKA